MKNVNSGELSDARHRKPPKQKPHLEEINIHYFPSQTSMYREFPIDMFDYHKVCPKTCSKQNPRCHGLQPVGETSNWNHSPRVVGGTQRLRHGLFSNQGLRFGALDEVENFLPPEFLPGKSLRFMKGFLHESNNFVSGYGWDGRGVLPYI